MDGQPTDVQMQPGRAQYGLVRTKRLIVPSCIVFSAVFAYLQLIATLNGKHPENGKTLLSLHPHPVSDQGPCSGVSKSCTMAMKLSWQ